MRLIARNRQRKSGGVMAPPDFIVEAVDKKIAGHFERSYNFSAAVGILSPRDGYYVMKGLSKQIPQEVSGL